MEETRVHTATWNEAVDAARRIADMPIGTEEILDDWLKTSRQGLLRTVAEVYQQLALAERFSIRYLTYFLGCVLSHHEGGTQHHSLPTDLRFGDLVPSEVSLQGAPYASDGYYRVTYSPMVEQDPHFRWQRVSLPHAFSVLWPNNPGLMPGSLEKQDDLGNKVKSIYHEGITWFMRYGYAFRKSPQDDQWWDSWLFYGPGVAERPVHEVLGLLGTAEVLRTMCAIPVLTLPNKSYQIYLRGGAPIDSWRQPHIETDPTIDKYDRQLADRCEKVMAFLGGNPVVAGRMVGRPAEPRSTPTVSYREFVAQEYRKECQAFGGPPRPGLRRALKDAVRKRAEKLYPPEMRTPLPRNWHEPIEAEKPWKKK